MFPSLLLNLYYMDYRQCAFQFKLCSFTKYKKSNLFKTVLVSLTLSNVCSEAVKPRLFDSRHIKALGSLSG